MKHRGRKVGKRLIACDKCGCTHLNPLPKRKALKKYYAQDRFYAEHSPADWLEKELSEYEAGLNDPYFQHVADLLQCGMVIDYGCGLGLLVHFLNQQRHFQAVGIEPSQTARELSPATEYLYPTVTALDADRSYFRGHVILSLVLEHVINPATWLRKNIMPLLRTGQKIVIVVPNEFNILQQRVGGDWFIAPVHVNYFTPASLQVVMEKAGLKVVSQGATCPMELFILGGSDYRDDDALGRICHGFRLALERRLGPPIFTDLYQMLFDTFGIGRELIFVGEKK